MSCEALLLDVVGGERGRSRPNEIELLSIVPETNFVHFSVLSCCCSTSITLVTSRWSTYCHWRYVFGFFWILQNNHWKFQVKPFEDALVSNCWVSLKFFIEFLWILWIFSLSFVFFQSIFSIFILSISQFGKLPGASESATPNRRS